MPTESLVDRSIEPRLNQVFVPLLSIIEDEQAREDLKELARKYHRELVADRSQDMEAQVLEIIRDSIARGEERLSVKDITEWFIDRHGADYERKITSKRIGNIIRKKLFLKTQKSHGVFIVPLSEEPKLARLYEKYGISLQENAEPQSDKTSSG